MILSFWVCVIRFAQSTQNNNVTISLQYLKENENSQADILFADKYQRFLQIDTITLGVCGQACSNCLREQVCYLQYLKKEVSDGVDFLHADKHGSFLQIDTMIFDGMVKHSQSYQNSKFTMTLQYLKVNGKNEVDFLLPDKHQRFLQTDTINFGVWPGMSKLPKITSLPFAISRKRSEW